MTRLKDRNFLLRLLGTVLALVLLIYLLTHLGWDEILLALQKIPLSILFLAFGLTMISRFAVTGRWHILMRGSGLEIPFRQSLRITFAGLFATNFLPTTVGGDVVRLAGAVRLMYDAALVTASLIADRLVGMAGMAVTLPLGLPAFIEWLQGGNLGMSAEVEGFFAFASVGSQTGWLGKILERGRKFIRHLGNALVIYVRQPRSILSGLIFTAIHMTCMVGMLSLFFSSLGEPISAWLIAGLSSLVYFITLIPISINGYGLQELSFTVIFSQLGGVSLESSLTVALLNRTMVLLASLPGAVFISGIMAGDQANLSDEGVLKIGGDN